MRRFLASLEACGDLVRIAAPADPVLEIAAITDRVCKGPGGGPALLFEHPVHAAVPVATNLFGSEQRVCQALGVTAPRELTGRLAGLLDRIATPDLAALDRQIAALPEFAACAPVPAGPDRAGHLPEMHPPDLTRLPFLQSWPGDGSAAGCPRYITMGQVHTVDPENGSRNVGLYRAQVRGVREVAVQWKSGSGAARHAERYRRRNEAMPVAIVLGGDPALLFSAMMPLPGDLDEVTFAGFLRGAPFALEPCASVPLAVPAGAEIVIEGWCRPGETVQEGPYGNHTGGYAPAAPAQLMRVSAIRCRPGAIVPATLVGPPPMEDCRMAVAWERLLAAFLRRLVPPVSDVHFPLEWVFRQSAIISLDQPRPGMVREIAARLWATPWFEAARLLIFVAAGGADFSTVAWRAVNLKNYADDIILDTAAQRLAIDATGCGGASERLELPPELRHAVECRWPEFGLG